MSFSTDSMDFSSMTLTQIKRQEMDSQVGGSHTFWETHLVVSLLGCPGWGIKYGVTVPSCPQVAQAQGKPKVRRQ